MKIKRQNEIDLICCHNQAQKIITNEIDKSESINIYHHQIQKKRIKQSSIIKLDTPDQGMLLGHQACSQYLEDSV